MEVKASAKYLRVSPNKLRLLAKGLSGLPLKQALEQLSLYRKKGAEFLIKLLKQAEANAVNNFKENPDLLFIKKIEVGEGTRLKRQDISHGARFDRGVIKKRTSHIYAILESKEVKSDGTKS